MNVVNLTALAEARARMTTGQWTVSESPKRWVDITAPQDEITANRAGDAAGLVATHNAADVLIEVARAAKAWLDSDDEDRPEEIDALIAALAKVTL